MRSQATRTQETKSQKALGTSERKRSRFTRRPSGGLVLGPRDEALLAALFLNRTMTRGQIQSLFFTSVPRCNARLRQLFDWGYLSRAYLPTAPFGSQALYCVGKAGVPLVSENMASVGIRADEADIRAQCRRPALSLLEHTLAIGDVYIAVQKALSAQPQAMAAQPRVRLEYWLPEHFCCHEYEVRRTEGADGSGKRRWRKEVFKPDAFLRFARVDAPPEKVTYQRDMHRPKGCCADRNYFLNYFLEVDRGHTNSRQFAGKLRTHARFLQSGLFADVFGWEDFRTLVVTTGRRRVDNLRALAEQAGNDLFWFTTFEEVEQRGILSAIWQAPFTEDLRELITDDLRERV